MFIFFLGLGDVGKGVGGVGFSGLMLKGSRFQNCFMFYTLLQVRIMLLVIADVVL